MITLVDTVIKNIVSLENGKTNMQAQFIFNWMQIANILSISRGTKP